MQSLVSMCCLKNLDSQRTKKVFFEEWKFIYERIEKSFHRPKRTLAALKVNQCIAHRRCRTKVPLNRLFDVGVCCARQIEAQNSNDIELIKRKPLN